ELTTYWEPERLLESSRLSPEDLPARFEELMSRAVDRALTGQDLVSLSGGIDSTAVAAFAADPHRARTGRSLPALSAVYPRHATVDERRYIELTADRLGLDLHTYEPEPRRLERLPEWVDAFDGPWDVWIPESAEENYLRARLLGGHTILTGEFAELVVDIQRDLLTHLLLQGKLPSVLRQLSEQHRAGTRPRALTRQVFFAFAPRFLVAAWKRRRPGFSPPHWVDPVRIRAREARRAVRRRDRWPAQQLGFLRGPGLSVEADAILQARCGVRVRRPWTDVDLWEFFLSLPAELKFPHAWSKSLVRQLLRGRVPDTILDRQDKTVFNEFVQADIDYPSLRRWLVEPRHRIQGIDYRALSERLEREDLKLSDYIWAKDLAAIQAFLDRW
ncbi:MAG: asparagine synthase-related protein, partial [Acidimicrobiia bacterium]